jgi:hypothetical protein
MIGMIFIRRINTYYINFGIFQQVFVARCVVVKIKFLCAVFAQIFVEVAHAAQFPFAALQGCRHGAATFAQS